MGPWNCPNFSPLYGAPVCKSDRVSFELEGRVKGKYRAEEVCGTVSACADWRLVSGYLSLVEMNSDSWEKL